MSDPKPLSLSQIFWLLDYDGSMCPHREEWEFGDYKPESLCQILDTLAKKSKGLMWNTGRTVESLGSQSPDFTRHAGFFEHGAFYWDGKTKIDLIKQNLPTELVEKIKAWASDRAEWVSLEFKHHSLRVIPLHAQDRSRLRAEFLDSEVHDLIERTPSVYTSEGWRAFEVLLTKANKSNSIAHLNANVKSFAGAVPVAVGDDVGDAEIIREVLRLGGHAFLVGSHCGWIADIEHKSSQVSFFTTPQELVAHLEDVIAEGHLIDQTTKTKIPHALLVS